MTDPGPPPTDARAALLAAYHPKPGVADELYDTLGAIRPVWQPLIDSLSAHPPEVIEAHFSRGRNYLRDAGVFFRQHTAVPAPERDWPLSPVPVILHESEWATICDGLTQRANLLEHVVADLYGPANLVTNGHLPAELIARSGAWLRPLVGIQPASGHFLHHLSFEISRNPDGSWFVLGDRAQIPSGAGFALENRIATARVFNDLYPRSNVHRLARFFRQFRAAIDGLTGGSNRRAALLTPGPDTTQYLEHTYIARYLGLMLLEGEDLVVRNGQVMVRTVEGPEPLGALWRRVESDHLDPLELNESSLQGTPGLVNALRLGSINMINALGTGVLEMRAMMAFLPKISELVTGEPLRLPNIATWWCGQANERDYVKANADSLMIGGAIDQDLPLDKGAVTALGAAFRGGASDAIGSWIDEDGAFLVGQELVTLSTAPAYIDGQLVPRPMTIRVTAVRTRDGWAFMPGGYARFGSSDETTALDMQRGGSVADVWIVSDNPIADDSLINEGTVQHIDAEPLPSRAAENLFWLGRYVERIETVLRLVRAYHLRLAETDDPTDARLLALDQFMQDMGIVQDAPIPSALGGLVESAKTSASKIRDRFSTDGWAALQDLSKTVAQMQQTAVPGDDVARAMTILLRKITGFSGLVHENMYRFAGWRFLAFGRALERCESLASILIVFAGPDMPEGYAEIAVELGDSAMTHRRRYRGVPVRGSVLDLLVCDALNPRSVLFQLNQMVTIASQFPKFDQTTRVSAPARVLLPLQSIFSVAVPDEISEHDLHTLRTELARASDLLRSAYLS